MDEPSKKLFELRNQIELEVEELQREIGDIKKGAERLDSKAIEYKTEMSDLGTKLCQIKGKIRAKRSEINEKRIDIRNMGWKSFEIQQENDALKSQLLSLEKKGVNLADIRKKYSLST